MRLLPLLRTLPLFAVLTLVVNPAAADDKKKPDDPFAAYEAAAKPGPEHKKLQYYVGNWTYTMKMWLDPSQPPSESKGTTKTTSLLDGRFIREEITGNFMGKPFHGLGITGYDKVQKKYTSIWMDSMSTAITHASGTWDASGKVFTTHRDEVDPVTSEKRKAKDVTTLVDDDHYTVDFYMVGPDGKEIKTMELKATRVPKKNTAK